MTASHPACMATSAEVSGPQPQGPHTEWADAETSSLVWSDPNTSAAHAMGSTMVFNSFFPKQKIRCHSIAETGMKTENRG